MVKGIIVFIILVIFVLVLVALAVFAAMECVKYIKGSYPQETLGGCLGALLLCLAAIAGAAAIGAQIDDTVNFFGGHTHSH